MNIKLSKLRNFNFFMAGLHALQALAIIIFSKDFTLPITYSFLKFDTVSRTLAPQSKELFTVSLPWLIALFLLLSSAAHLIIATVYNKTYNADLKKGINKARWIEYSISASVMMVAIAMLVGIYDLGTLIAIFSLVAIMNLCGLIMEVHNQTTAKTSWLSFNIGSLAGIIPWVIVGLYFWGSAQNGSAPPTFVYWIYVSIFLFFDCFALNMILQYMKVGKWRDYLYG